MFKVLHTSGRLRERACFTKDMDEWSLLSDDFRAPLLLKWRKLMAMSKRPDSDTLIRTVFELATIANGISNAAAHMLGYIAKEVEDYEKKKDPSIPAECALDSLLSAINTFLLNKYHALLQDCGCNYCKDVIHHDTE